MPELENKADKIFETLWSDNEFREYTGNNNIPLEFIINLVDKVSDMANEQLKKENEQLKKICDYNCPVHKLATHNTCLTCSAVRNSPYHNLKDVSEEELQEIKNEAEKEAEM